MADSDIVLRFVSTSDSDADARTFCVFQVLENGYGDLELYKFSHPLTGQSMGTTTFSRKNLDACIFETAGHIEWFSRSNATVRFGVDEAPVKDLRRIKTGGQSRRFKASGVEYKWRLRENGSDMYCIDPKERHVATWNNTDRILKVAPHCRSILDRIVVTCFLNVWFKTLGKW